MSFLLFEPLSPFLILSSLALFSLHTPYCPCFFFFAHVTSPGWLIDRPATGRAQRASARQQNWATTTVDATAENEASLGLNLPADSEPFTNVLDDESTISRSNSFQNTQEGPSTSTSSRLRRKDKGKGKEVECATVRIKEEARTFSLLKPDMQTANLVRLSGIAFSALIADSTRI